MKFSLIVAMVVFAISTSQVEGQSKSKKMVPVKQQRQLNLGPVVAGANQISIDQIDHSSWNDLLSKYVDEAGGVDYAGLKASQPCYQSLDAYIDHLASASLTQASRRENQMAFWINAYNAVTIKGILQEYPTTSIKNHTSENGGYNLWKQLLLNVGGHQVSLDAMEHQVLRKMGDPRIHFAIVCASKGCPRLLNEAYVGDRLNDQLNTNAVNFFSQAQNFQYNQRSRSFGMSSIMQWFGGDFGQSQADQLRAISPYLPTPEAQAAANANAVSVSYLDYSWELNKQAPKPKGSATKGGSQAKMGSAAKGSAAKGSASKGSTMKKAAAGSDKR